ncbi:MAG: hypothetical protein ABGW81_09575, partial [Paracoccaceae bacterium]
MDSSNAEILRPKAMHWPLVVLRGLTLAIGSFILVSLYLLFHYVEVLLPRLHATSLIASLWGRLGLLVTGIKLEIVGKHMKHGGAIVANHATWIDIFTF